MSSEVRDYAIANKVAYEYYKFNCTANNGDPAMMAIMELQFLQGGVIDLTTKCSGSVTESSESHATYPVSKAFDGIKANDSASRWLGVKSDNMYLVYKFNAPTRVNAISLFTPGESIGWGTATRAPKDWKFQCSTDGVNWKTLEEHSNMTDWTSSAEERYYKFDNSIKYEYYKFECTALNGATDYIQLIEMEFYYYDDGTPGLGDCTLTRNSATSYAVSVPLLVNNVDTMSYIVSDGTTATTNAFATGVSEGSSKTVTVSDLATDKTYQISILAVNSIGESVKEAGTVYTGELSLGATSNASESTGTPGTVEVSRATADPVTLTVYYTISGAGTDGETWETPVGVTIPAGQTTGYLVVNPLADVSVSSDIEVTVALAEGNYGVPASGNSATLTIVNSDVPSGYEVLEITNALDNPAGGFFTPAYGSALKNTSGRIIRFADPATADSGLRMFSQSTPNQWSYVNSGEGNVSRDWLLFTFVNLPTAAETVGSISCATTPITGLKDRQDVRTFTGSWYIPADGTYSFRMHMGHVGIFSLDGKLILRQATTAAVTTNNVALAAGWHNFHAAFASSSAKTIGPADGETLGFSFSASNAALTTAEPGTAFSADNCTFKTAFNSVLVPSMWAEGGEVVIDCANLSGDLRIIGQLASTNQVFKIVNLPSGRTLELGRPGANDLTGWQNLESTAYIDWMRTSVPSGVNIRFEGMATIDGTWGESGRGSMASGAFSLGQNAILFVDVPNFFGPQTDEFHYPDGLWSLHAASPQVLGDTAKIFVPDNRGFGFGGSPFYLFRGSDNKKPPYLPIYYTPASKLNFMNDVELGTGAAVNKTLTGGAGDDRLCGDVNGANGSARITGYSSYMKLCGRVTVKDTIVQQLGCRTSFMPHAGSEPSSISGTLTLGADIKEYDPNNSSWSYGAPTFCYCPETPGEHPLSVNVVSTSGAKFCPQNVGTLWNNFTHTTRQGSTLSTCSNNTVNVKKLQGSGVNLCAAVPIPKAQLFDERVYENGVGPANFVFGEINGSASMPILVSTNVNITVTNIAKAAAFHYEVMSNGVNEAFLDIENPSAAGAAGSTITATDIAMLPGRIKGFTGNVTLTDTTEGRAYNVVYDFDRGVAIGGCDGSGKLVAAPSTGAINLSFTGTPRKGNFGVLRFDSFAEGVSLENWTISAPERCNGYSISLHKDANGFSFNTHAPFMILVR